LREAFGIGRLTEGQSEAVSEALGRVGVFAFPHPFASGPSLRLYDKKHPVASVAEAITQPDVVPETPLRRAAEAFARESAGRDLRSDDAPWLTVFDLFLQIVQGRDPDGWEEMRDDRHPSELAKELGIALGLERRVAELPSTIRLAAAVNSFRPRQRKWRAGDFTAPDEAESALHAFADDLASVNRHLRDEHDRLLRHAALLLVRAAEIPTGPVELGLLGLRYRREDMERNAR
jgi:hypothetical protein